MKFFDYFTEGLKNTLKLKNRAGMSFKNEAVPVRPNTILDTWYMGDFTSATYEVAVEYGANDIERLTVVVSARVNQASLTVYGRTNSGKDLVQFTTTVNSSNVSLIVSPFYSADNVSSLTGVYLTWTAVYAERMVRLQIPTTDGESTNIGGELGVLSNWTSNLGNNVIQVNDAGSIAISNIGTIISLGIQPLVSAFILDTLTLQNTDGNISIVLTPTVQVSGSISGNTLTITSNNGKLGIGMIISDGVGLITGTTIIAGPLTGTATSFSSTWTVSNTGTVTGISSIISNTLTISLSQVPNLTVNYSFISTIQSGTLDNTRIGPNTPLAGTVSTLSISGTTSLSQSNSVITIKPKGVGTVNLHPTQVGTIDNIVIGSVVPVTAKFTTLTITQQPTLNNQLVSLGNIQARLLLGAI